MTRFTMTMLTALAALFAVLFLYQQQKATALQRKLDELQSLTISAQDTTKTITVTDTALQHQVQTLQVAHDAATNRAAVLAQAVQQLETATASNQVIAAAAMTAERALATHPAKKSDDSAKGFAQSLATLLKDPAMKDTLRTQTKMALEPMYAGLIQDLGLQNEDAVAFRELLVERQMGAVGLSAQLMDGSLSVQQEKDVMAQIEKEQAQVDGMIKNMLGDENYARYKDYQKTEHERMVLSQFRQQLSGTDATLDRATEDKLVGAMGSAREELRKSGDYFDAKKSRPGEYTSDAVAKYQQQEERISASTLDKARAFMSPKQFEKFQAFQESQLQMRAAQMKMAQRMFDKSAPADKK
ncbi:MAG: hypothetical protein NTV22_19925 [bacterium]|nr:hypothetical protein [bacterium]